MKERFESSRMETVEPVDDLYWENPTLWVRAAIGVETGRDTSDVSDYELAGRYNDGGFAEWDPRVADAVRAYLKSVGLVDLRLT